nr:helix-turn-helix transcriptional regulator [Marinicella marina]
MSNQIRSLRFHHEEMTQQQLADLVGVTRQTINAIEHNKYSPSLEVAFKIAVAFNKPLTEVFQYEAH